MFFSFLDFGQQTDFFQICSSLWTCSNADLFFDLPVKIPYDPKLTLLCFFFSFQIVFKIKLDPLVVSQRAAVPQ